MDFAETEDQQMIREMVREFAETVAGPTCEKERQRANSSD